MENRIRELENRLNTDNRIRDLENKSSVQNPVAPTSQNVDVKINQDPVVGTNATDESKDVRDLKLEVASLREQLEKAQNLDKIFKSGLFVGLGVGSSIGVGKNEPNLQYPSIGAGANARVGLSIALTSHIGVRAYGEYAFHAQETEQKTRVGNTKSERNIDYKNSFYGGYADVMLALVSGKSAAFGLYVGGGYENHISSLSIEEEIEERVGGKKYKKESKYNAKGYKGSGAVGTAGIMFVYAKRHVLDIGVKYPFYLSTLEEPGVATTLDVPLEAKRNIRASLTYSFVF